MLQQIIIQSSNINPVSDILGLKSALLVTAITPTSVYWFTPYKSADFPEVTCDTDYFFLYGTDHDSDGGIWWGKGDNLDLSDFVELGQVVASIYSSETPFLTRYENETDSLRLYYHTNISDPSNTGIQETKLITSTGGLLHTATWNTQSNPLGIEAEDQHTGYYKKWDVDGSQIAIHYKKGANNVTGFIGEYQYSTPSIDGLTVTRGALVDQTSNMTANRRFVPTFGDYFKMFNTWWWIGTTDSTVLPFGFGATSKQLVLAKSNSSLEFLEELHILNDGNFIDGTWSVYVEGNTAHLYQNNKQTDVKYATLDLLQLENYL